MESKATTCFGRLANGLQSIFRGKKQPRNLYNSAPRQLKQLVFMPQNLQSKKEKQTLPEKHIRKEEKNKVGPKNSKKPSKKQRKKGDTLKLFCKVANNCLCSKKMVRRTTCEGLDYLSELFKIKAAKASNADSNDKSSEEFYDNEFYDDDDDFFFSNFTFDFDL